MWCGDGEEGHEDITFHLIYVKTRQCEGFSSSNMLEFMQKIQFLSCAHTVEFQCEVVERRIVEIAAESYEKSGFVVGERMRENGGNSWESTRVMDESKYLLTRKAARVNECEKQTTEN
jgi:hypothetical protein